MQGATTGGTTATAARSVASSSPYHLQQKELGKGAFGIVVERRYENGNGQTIRQQAVKRSQTTNGQRDLAHQFGILQTLQKQVKSSYFPKVYGYKTGQLSMQLLSRGQWVPLSQYIKIYYDRDQTQYFLRCPRIEEQLREAVSILHAHHILHNDLKPANVMIHIKSAAIKIIDYGLSYQYVSDRNTPIVPDTKSTLPHTYWCGTLAFFSPLLLSVYLFEKSMVSQLGSSDPSSFWSFGELQDNDRWALEVTIYNLWYKLFDPAQIGLGVMYPSSLVTEKGIRSFKDDVLFAQSLLFFYSRFADTRDVFKNPLVLYSAQQCTPLKNHLPLDAIRTFQQRTVVVPIPQVPTSTPPSVDSKGG